MNLKSHLWLLLVFAMAIDFNSCKKDKEDEQLSYIDYTLDGSNFHFESEDPMGATSTFAGAMSFVIDAAETDNTGPGTHVALDFILDPGTISTTSYDQTNSVATSHFTSIYLMNLVAKDYFIASTGSSNDWNITFSEFNATDGFSEGTFWFNNLIHKDENDSLLSTGYSVTNGKFRVKMN